MNILSDIFRKLLSLVFPVENIAETIVNEDIDQIAKMPIGYTGYTVPWALLVSILADGGERYRVLWLQTNYEVVASPDSLRTIKVTRTREGFVCDFSLLPDYYRWKPGNATGLEEKVTRVTNSVFSCQRAYGQASVPEDRAPSPPKRRCRTRPAPIYGETGPSEAERHVYEDPSWRFLKGLMVAEILLGNDSTQAPPDNPSSSLPDG